MEGKEIELSELELTLLDELVFSLHYNDVKKKVDGEESQLKEGLKNLLQYEFLIAGCPGPDDDLEFDLADFNNHFKEYYYLATKKGLKYLFV